jgi:hypothetical protein
VQAVVVGGQFKIFDFRSLARKAHAFCGVPVVCPRFESNEVFAVPAARGTSIMLRLRNKHMRA